MKHLTFWNGFIIVIFLLLGCAIGVHIAVSTYNKGYNQGVSDSKHVNELKINYEVNKVFATIKKANQQSTIKEIKFLISKLDNKTITTSEIVRLNELFYSDTAMCKGYNITEFNERN
jgi:hypothetical protein